MWWPGGEYGTGTDWLSSWRSMPWQGDPGWPLSARGGRHQADFVFRPAGAGVRTYGRSSDEGTYRGCCWHCGWLGDDAAISLEAVGEALDHSHAGWRTVPVVRRPAAAVGAGQGSAPMEAWRRRIESALPDGWLAGGGPLRTVRPSWSATSSGRPLPQRAAVPGGGWDMPGAFEPLEVRGDPKVRLVYVPKSRGSVWSYEDELVLDVDGVVKSAYLVSQRMYEERRMLQKAQLDAERELVVGEDMADLDRCPDCGGELDGEGMCWACEEDAWAEPLDDDA